MEHSIACPWEECQFRLPDKIQLDFHVMLYHCDHGRFITHYYHDYNRDLGSLLQRGNKQPDEKYHCKYGICKMEFDNLLQMNVHVIECHLEHIIPLEQNYTQMNPAFMVPNDVDPLNSSQCQPRDDTQIPEEIIISDDDSENSSDCGSVDQPRKTYKLRSKKRMIESQDDNSSDSDSYGSESEDEEDTDDNESESGNEEETDENDSEIDDEENMEYNEYGNKDEDYIDQNESQSSRQTSVFDFDIYSEVKDCIDGEKHRYLGADNTKRPFYLSITMRLPTRKHTTNVCYAKQCGWTHDSVRKVENHFRREHLHVAERHDHRVYGRKTENKKYDEMKKRGELITPSSASSKKTQKKMDDSISCPWSGCQFIFADQMQLDFHVMLNHCEYGRVISHYYHNCNRNLSALIQTGTGSADKTHDCGFKNCILEFENELQMNVHVMIYHLKHIIQLEQSQTQMNQVRMVPNDIKPLRLIPFQPEGNVQMPTEPIILNDDEMENNPDPCPCDQPRKTFTLRKRKMVESQDDDDSSGSDNGKDAKDKEYIPDSQISAEDSQNIVVDPEECENLETTMVDYPNMPIKERPYFFKVENERRTRFHCLFAECEEKRCTQKKIENHFRSVHLKISKEMEGFVHAKRTEEKRYDDLFNKGLIRG